MRFPKTAVAFELLSYVILLSVLYVVLFPINNAHNKSILESIEDQRSSHNYAVVNLARIKQKLNMQLDFHDAVFLEHATSLIGLPEEGRQDLENREMSSVTFWYFNEQLVRFSFILGAFLLVFSKILRLPKAKIKSHLRRG